MSVCNILSIDAWAEPENSWNWNNWHKVGEIVLEDIPKTNRAIIMYMRKKGYLSDKSKGRVTVEDDGYSLVIIHKSTGRPLFAIEYGPHV